MEPSRHLHTGRNHCLTSRGSGNHVWDEEVAVDVRSQAGQAFLQNKIKEVAMLAFVASLHCIS